MITRDEAGKALRDIETTSERSALAAGYRAASPHLLVWGAVWAAGYGLPATGLVGHGIWPWLIPIGVAGSFWFSRSLPGAGASRIGWRYAASVLVGVAFLAGLFSVFAPVTGQQVGTVLPLIVGLAYLQLGIWTGGLRIALVGLLVAGAALFAWHGAREAFDLLMAIAGGGGLIAGGLWLRRL